MQTISTTEELLMQVKVVKSNFTLLLECVQKMPAMVVVEHLNSFCFCSNFCCCWLSRLV